MNSEKLQKVLARGGLGSRRAIEEWIKQGRVSVNRQPAHVGARVSSQDEIRLDNRLIPSSKLFLGQYEILAYHKPEGEICSSHDPEGRPTVFERLPKPKSGKWILVGRLDINSSGLLLATTDGELANRLMHPSSGVEREYAVRVLGAVTPEQLAQLRTGVPLEDGEAKFDHIMEAGGEGANHWYHVVLHEGRNREVRRMWAAVGVTVSRLIRIRYGAAKLPPYLRAGRHIPLPPELRAGLLEQAGLTWRAQSFASEELDPRVFRRLLKPRKDLAFKKTAGRPRTAKPPAGPDRPHQSSTHRPRGRDGGK